MAEGDSFLKGLIVGLFTGLVAGFILAGFGAWAVQAICEKRGFIRSSKRRNTDGALRSPDQLISDDEVWTRTRQDTATK